MKLVINWRFFFYHLYCCTWNKICICYALPRTVNVVIRYLSVSIQLFSNVAYTNCRNQRTMTSHKWSIWHYRFRVILRLSILAGRDNNDCRFSGHHPTVEYYKRERAVFLLDWFSSHLYGFKCRFMSPASINKYRRKSLFRSLDHTTIRSR